MTDNFYAEELFAYDTYWENEDVGIKQRQELELMTIKGINNMPRWYLQSRIGRRRTRF